MKNLTKEQLIKKLTEERDLAIKQLNSIGVGLGDNMDHVKKALEQRWVPVSERLPEVEGAYLVTKETVSGIRPVTTAMFMSDGSFSGSMKTVAWMPLPEPYKGVE